MCGATGSLGAAVSTFVTWWPCWTRSQTTARPALPLPPVTTTRMSTPFTRLAADDNDRSGRGGSAIRSCHPPPAARPPAARPPAFAAWPPAQAARVRASCHRSVHSMHNRRPGRSSAQPSTARAGACVHGRLRARPRVGRLAHCQSIRCITPGARSVREVAGDRLPSDRRSGATILVRCTDASAAHGASQRSSRVSATSAQRIRSARRRIAISQMELENRTGVDQTSISRLERGVAPRFPVEKLVRLGRAIGSDLPLGFCPHEHDCAWQAPVRPQRMSASRLLLLRD